MKSFILILSSFLMLCNSLVSQSIVTIQRRTLLVNGLEYRIHGVCYNPVKIGDDQTKALDFSHIDQDILLMQQANINTIRMYSPALKLNELDKFAAAGIKVIVGFPNYISNSLYPDINHGTYLNYINTYKNHSAILMWELGNEYNYHPEWFPNTNWYTILNNAAANIHSADPNHPVSTAHGEVPSASAISLCPNIDVWGMNVYRWDNPSGAISQFLPLSAKPCYLSESGADRYNKNEAGENQQNQATADLAIWNNIKGSFGFFAGITFFSFVDEWWKGGNPNTQDATGFINNGVPYDSFANEEWWGLVDINRNTTPAFDAIKNAFTQFTTGIESKEVNQETVLFPNPAKLEANLRLSKPTHENIVVNISTTTGSVLVSEPMVVNGIEIRIALEKFNLAKGTYIISITGKTLNINKLLILR